MFPFDGGAVPPAAATTDDSIDDRNSIDDMFFAHGQVRPGVETFGATMDDVEFKEPVSGGGGEGGPGTTPVIFRALGNKRGLLCVQACMHATGGS